MAEWRNSPIAKCLAALAVFAALQLSLRGQTQAPRPQFREGVDAGHVDVTVLDGKRQAVRSLTAADFTLRLDGKVQPIRTFAAVDFPGPPPTLTVAPWTREIAPDVQTNTTPDEGRLVVIFWDRSIPPGPKMEVAKRIARAAVNELGPNDLAAITAVRSRPVQNFTADRARLLKAIENAHPGSADGEDERMAAANIAPSGSGINATFLAHEACFCNACVLEQIRDIANELRLVPRPKILLFIGSQLTMDTRDAAPLGNAMSPIGAECAWPLKSARASMMQALDVANVTVHSLDPSGLESSPVASAASPLGRSTSAIVANQTRNLSAAYHGQIRVLPDRTGGRVVTNTNAPEAFVPAVFAESGSYYVLGFDVPSGLKGPEKVEVKVNRSGAKVHVQRAYEPPAPAPILTGSTASAPSVWQSPSSSLPASGLARWAAEAVLPARGLPMSATAMPVAVPGAEEAAVIIVSGLQSSSGESARSAVRTTPEQFEVLVAALDPRARSKAETRHSIEVDATAARHYDIVSHLSLKPGSYEIRSAAVARDGRSGSVVTYVDVPDFREEALSLSGLALTTMPAGAGTAVGVTADKLPFVPTARRSFAASETLRTFLKVYQGGTDAIAAVQLEVRIIDTRGQVMLNAGGPLDAGRWNADRSASFGLDMPLAALAPGEYLLTIAVTEGKNSARRDVRFAISSF